MFERGPVGSAGHRRVVGAHFQETALTRVVEGEAKIHSAVIPAFVDLLASSL